VIGADGRVSLPPGKDFAEQRRRLRGEGVAVDGRGCVDLDVYRWRPEGEFSFA
jgi:alkylated DNA nucleotide flippase Atl1